MSEQELWDDAIRAFEAAGHDASMLRAGADGHRNRRHIAIACLADVSGCPCGAAEPCADVDSPERRAAASALSALVAAIGAPEKVARGNSPP